MTVTESIGELNAYEAEGMEPRSIQAFYALIFLTGIGLVGIVIYSLQERVTAFAVVSNGILAAGSFLLIGGLLGFLFGIPRTKEKPESDENGGYQANTNLEQISDWLTKILVGVGLTQMETISQKLGELAEFLAKGLTNAPTESANTAAAFIIVFFLVAGFLLGYLWTRLYLAGALTYEETALEKMLGTLQGQVSNLEKQIQADHRAKLHVHNILHAEDVEVPVDQTALLEALQASSEMAKEDLFRLTRLRRKETWRQEQAKMARTIPVFKALIESNGSSESIDHAHYGQLGYAYHDNEEYSEGWECLNKAIEVRDKSPHPDHSYLLYELLRAKCAIRLAEDEPADPKMEKRVILADIMTAARSTQARRIIAEDEVLQTWLEQNQIDQKKLWREEDE